MQKYEKGLPAGQDFMTIKSPMLLLVAMIALGVVGVVGFVWLITMFFTTGDGGYIAGGIFVLVMFGLLSAIGILIALRRLRWKREYREYHKHSRNHPGEQQ